MSDRSWTLLLHGGARTISPKQAAASRRGCLAAAWVGQRVLHGGGAALDAAIMDGATLDIGGVAAIRDVRHPVSVARSLLREIHVLLTGEGASRFADRKRTRLNSSNECAYRMPPSP